MKSRPILFSAPMVRAILDGKKTMTRRAYKPRFDSWQVGDRLWVRETYSIVQRDNGYNIAYRADGEEYGEQWKPSIFMPRKYSRILLEITDLKRERLQDISEADAKREGVEPEISYQNGFRSIWEQINGRASWKQNPEVVAIGFKVLETKGGVCE